MTLETLTPEYEEVKSYWRKAHVENLYHRVTLYSYRLKILSFDEDDQPVYLNKDTDAYTHTTMRHLREFLRQQRHSELASHRKNQLLQQLQPEQERTLF